MFSLILIPLIISMFLAINMGASGTAPSFSASYGANLIRKDLIPGLFGIFVFLGAVFGGKEVSITIGKNILASESLSLSVTTGILFSISLSLLIANLLGIPQSTSQSTIFALLGASIYVKNIQIDKLLFQIIPTWFILPIVAFFLIFFVGKFFYRIIKNSGWIDFEKIKDNKKIKFLVIMSSCYVAFSIGANNVANASGLISSMVMKKLQIVQSNDNFLLVMILSTLIIAPCFGIGSSLLGFRNLETTGKKIVTFGPLGALLVSFITASLLLGVSILGIPTSEVQLSTGAIIGLGICKNGYKGILKKKTLKKICLVWIISPIIAFLLSFLFAWILDFLN